MSQANQNDMVKLMKQMAEALRQMDCGYECTYIQCEHDNPSLHAPTCESGLALAAYDAYVAESQPEPEPISNPNQRHDDSHVRPYVYPEPGAILKALNAKKIGGKQYEVAPSKHDADCPMRDTNLRSGLPVGGPGCICVASKEGIEMKSVYGVSCPVCCAAAGYHCTRNANGWSMPTKPHKERVEAAESKE